MVKNIQGLKAGLSITGIMLVVLSVGCTKAGSAASSSDASSAIEAATIASKVAKAVYCQIDYSSESTLPSCQSTTSTCPNSQVQDENGNCVAYTCDSVKVLTIPTDGSTLQIPDRSVGTTHGVCYAVHLLNSVAEGASSLTTVHDTTVVTRNHDLNAGDPTNHWNPYLMGEARLAFQMNNEHEIDLTGAADASTPVLVDNFIIVGIAPVLANNPFQPIYYGAFGTSDSTTTYAGGTGNILINNIPIQLTAFASGGTASVGPLNVSSQVSTGITYNLDVRAEDCGGSRNLSDIYIQFR